MSFHLSDYPAGPTVLLSIWLMFGLFADIVRSWWPNATVTAYNWRAPLCFAWVALIFGRHMGLTVVEQYVIVTVVVVGVQSILPQSK